MTWPLEVAERDNASNATMIATLRLAGGRAAGVIWPHETPESSRYSDTEM
ncbi:MAG: hypothetical protein WA214_03400 [Pseudolabrys sp.]